jgi:lathosterol oxidase
MLERLTDSPQLPSEPHVPQAERLELIFEENQWKNNMVMWIFPQSIREQIPHAVQTWIRNLVMVNAVYFGVGLAWCYYVYFCYGDVLFAPGTIPGFSDVAEQIRVSSLAMPLYSILPTMIEMAAEKGLTMAYPRIENVGLPMYVIYFFLYMTSVEFGVYWMHRGLHEIKWAYKYLHYDHHKYNKEHTLSPFAGLAFHPIDGILQAIPYGWTMFYCPMHFLTHELLLFMTGVWTANIHDNIHGKVWPILGARYHTIHHTTYKTNYGHYFIFMDKIFGTLETPEDYEKKQHT